MVAIVGNPVLYFLRLSIKSMKFFKMENMNVDNIFWNIYLIVEDIKDAKAA